MATPAGFIHARWCKDCGINFVVRSEICESILEWRRKWKQYGFVDAFGLLMPDALAAEHPPLLIGGCKPPSAKPPRKIRKYAGNNPAFGGK